MSISNEMEFLGMKRAGEAVGTTLREMREFARPGMTTKELDNYGAGILKDFGAHSAPHLSYNFPGCTCISVNNEVAHGIPSDHTILKEGDLVNIDVSAELNGYWADNGSSFILGKDLHKHEVLVSTSKDILFQAIKKISDGIKIAEIGRLIETEARKSGYNVIKNLVGHGIGRSLHEDPKEIPCYYDKYVTGRFQKNSVVAIETFISTKARHAYANGDGWTLVTRDGSFVAQHEHTILITDNEPVIFTESNQMWN